MKHIRGSFENLYPHESLLKSWLLNRFPDLHDVDDIIQDSYLKVYVAHRKTGVKHPKSYPVCNCAESFDQCAAESEGEM